MNRQVPNKTYAIIGDGKVARHIEHYFTLLGIPFNHWHRAQSTEQLQQNVAQSDAVLLLIADDAIQSFIQNHLFLQHKTLVHFSGTLLLDKALGCHPLMTFGHDLYALDAYQKIPFVCDKGVVFDALFPALPNHSFSLDPQQKAYYHAMCVMAGNFTQTLMRETANQLHEKLDLPADILFPYLLQNTKNFIANPETSATGPLQRGDFTTVKKNLQALQGNALEGIYKSFLKFSKINALSHQVETPSFLRRQESHKECHDLKNNTVSLVDSCLRRNDESIKINNAVIFSKEATQ